MDSNNTPMISSGESRGHKFEILPESYAKYDLSFKIIVIGDSGVGKSCLTNKATKNIFDKTYNATVGFEFFTFNMKVDNKVLKLQIWDTCGQEAYRSLITNFYRNTTLAIIVYAINYQESFADIDLWLKELKRNANPDVRVFLIGNKVDLEEEREVTFKQGEDLANENKMDMFLETSSKTGFNALNVFIEAGIELYEDYTRYNSGKSDGVVKEEMEEEQHKQRNRGTSVLSKQNTNAKSNQGCGC